MYLEMYKYIILDEESYRISRETHLCAIHFERMFSTSIYTTAVKKVYAPPSLEIQFDGWAFIVYFYTFYTANDRKKQQRFIRARAYNM